MNSEKLPSENDAIVMGTGMIESIVSAALARIELNVLNIDREEHYGGSWGSFNLKDLKEFLRAPNDVQDAEILPTDLSPDEKYIPLKTPNSFIRNVHEYQDSVPSKSLEKFDDLKLTPNSNELSDNVVDDSTKEDLEKDATKDDYCTLHDEMMKKQRYFVLDLLPKMMFSRGAIVELLISSDVARYCEFKLVSRILTEIDGKIAVVPSSRSEVFTSTSVSVVEKRMLMKFLTFAQELEKHQDQFIDEHKSKTFGEFLNEWKLSPTVRHYIQHAIAMVTPKVSAAEGLEATRRYLQSHGRYGNSSLLSPLYGTGELVQCFCRMSAVFGGVYCLRRNLSGIIVKGNSIVSVLDSQGQRINTKWLLLESSYASQFSGDDGSQPSSSISRAILITDKSVCPDKENHISLANIPVPGAGGEGHVIMQELPPSSRACPQNYYVVHLTTPGEEARSDLSSFVDRHFHLPQGPRYEMSDARPNVLWMVYFNLEGGGGGCDSWERRAPFENVVFVPGPDHHLDCDSSVSTAEKIFKLVCPDKEFLPKAPSPEEIVFHDSSPTDAVAEDFFRAKEEEEEKNEEDQLERESSPAAAIEEQQVQQQQQQP